MDVKARKIHSVIVLDLAGTLTLSEDTRKLHCLLESFLSENERHFVLNMQNVSLMEFAGIGQLALSYRRVLERGGDLKLLNLNRRLHHLLKMMRLLTVIESFENEQDAVSSFRARGALAAETPRSPGASNETDPKPKTGVVFWRQTSWKYLLTMLGLEGRRGNGKQIAHPIPTEWDYPC